MGETYKDALRVNFDRKLKLEFHGVKVTNDAEQLCVDPAMRQVVGDCIDQAWRQDRIIGKARDGRGHRGI